MKAERRIEYENHSDSESILNTELENIKKAICNPNNWPIISNDLEFKWLSFAELRQGYQYQAKKKMGETEFANFSVVEFNYIPNKSLRLVTEQQGPGSFFSAMRNEHDFIVQENGIHYKQEISYTSKLKLEHIIQAYLGRFSHRLHRMIENPESFELENKIRATKETVKYRGFLNSAYRGYKVAYLSSQDIPFIKTFLKDPKNYEKIYPAFKNKETEKIIMTFMSATGQTKIEFKVIEKENELIFKSKKGSGFISEIYLIHRLSKAQSGQTRHELEIKYYLTLGIITNNIADSIPLIEEGLTNMITTILRKMYEILEPIEVVKEEQREELPGLVL